MKRFIFFAISLVVFIVSIVAYLQYRNSFADLSISFLQQNSGVRVNVYKYDHDSEQDPTEADKVAGPLQSNTTIRIKKGSYIIVSEQTNDYLPIKKELNIDSSQSVDIEALFSQSRLETILQQEQSSIISALNNQYPQLNQLFTIGTIRLFRNGDWAGILLISKDTNPLNNDSLRTILKKEGQSWSVVTQPPQIVVSSITYPDVPRSVVEGVNSLKKQ